MNDALSESLGFVPPLSYDEGEQYWLQVKQNLLSGRLMLFCAFDGHRLLGTVQLQPATRANARHRAEVTNLIVAASH